MIERNFYCHIVSFLLCLVFFGFLSQTAAQSTVAINKIAGDKFTINQGNSNGVYENQVFEIVRMNANNKNLLAKRRAAC